MGQELFELAAGAALAEHGDDRVVARDRARDSGKPGLVDAPGDHVRGPRRRLDHGHRLDQPDRQHELADQRRRAAVAAARADQAELVDIARDGGLGRTHAAPGERGRDLLLGVHRPAVHEVADRALPPGLSSPRIPRLRLEFAGAPGIGRGHPAALRMRACALSICCAVMMSGGTSRTVWSSTALTIRPDSRHAFWNGFAFASSNSKACIRPRPRVCFAPRSWIDACSSSPISAAWPTRPSRSTTSSTVAATAHASGLPPNVEPWSPGSKTSARALASVAPIGTPPPRPFARVITSGVMPACWWANHRPVRPRPVWTSSRMSKRFWLSHHSRTRSRYPGAAGTIPISPITGSSITATVLSVVACSIAATSLYSTWTKPGGSGLNGSEYLCWPPAVTAASVRPWNEPVVVMISKAPSRFRVPHLRAILIADSFASAPELQKKTRDGNDSSTNRWASSTCGCVKYRLEVWMRVFACAVTAATTSGCECLSRFTAMPATRSRYSRPESS